MWILDGNYLREVTTFTIGNIFGNQVTLTEKYRALLNKQEQLSLIIFYNFHINPLRLS